MRRRALLAAATAVMEGNENLFPLHLTLNKLHSSARELSPTPETIALADYVRQNAVYDGLGCYEVSMPSGALFIDGLEVTGFIMYSSHGEYYDYFEWWPQADYGYINPIACLYISENLKGYLRHYDED